MAKNVATTKQAQVPAIPIVNPFADYGDEAFTSNIVGQLLKFNKGEWLVGKDETELPEDTQLVVGMPTLQSGWIKWDDNRPAEIKMGLRTEGFRPVTRDSLGDQDKSTWRELNGQKIDPWQRTDVILLADPTNGQVYTYSPASQGGLDAIKQLSKAYGSWYLTEPDMMPVVTLGSEWYKHETYGKVYKPVFEVVDKRDINDVSFEPADEDEKPAAKKAAGGKGKISERAVAARKNGKNAAARY